MDEDEKLTEEIKRTKKAFEAIASSIVSASRGKRTEVIFPEFSPLDDYEAAEAKCKCGWYGSADELIYVKGETEDQDKRLCPKCEQL